MQRRICTIGDKIKFQSLNKPWIYRDFTVLDITDHIAVCQAEMPNLSEIGGTYKHQEHLMIYRGLIISDYSQFYQICDNKIKFVKDIKKVKVNNDKRNKI